MATKLPESLDQIVGRELASLGFLLNSGTPARQTRSFNVRLRRLAQIATGARVTCEPALDELARKTICKFLCDVLGYQSLYRDAVAAVCSIDSHEILHPAAGNGQRSFELTAKINTVAFLRATVGEQFATTFYLALPPEESWRLFWKRVVGAPTAPGQTAYREPQHVCREFVTWYSHRLLTEWPSRAAYLMNRGLASLLRDEVHSKKALEGYTAIFNRSFGLDGLEPSCDQAAIGSVEFNTETIQHMIGVLEHTLESPTAGQVFTVVARYFSDEFAQCWDTLLPVSSGVIEENNALKLDDPLNALFGAATYTQYINVLEERGITSLRQLCLEPISRLKRIGRMKAQLEDGSSMSNRLRTVGLHFGMSTRAVAQWERSA